MVAPVLEGLPVTLLLLVLVDEARGIFLTVWRAWAKTLSRECKAGLVSLLETLTAGNGNCVYIPIESDIFFLHKQVEKGWELYNRSPFQPQEANYRSKQASKQMQNTHADAEYTRRFQQAR